MDTKWLTELGKKLSVARSQSVSYNIFQVLRIEDKEVLICRFLGDLLNPKGSHGCGVLFLKHFFPVFDTGSSAGNRAGERRGRAGGAHG